MLKPVIAAFFAVIATVPAASARVQEDGILDLAWRDFQVDAEKLRARVQSDPHFADFVIMNTRQPYAIVRFTGDAAARLRLYISDPRYRAMNAGISLAQLEAFKGRTAEALRTLDLGCFMVDADEQRSEIMIGVPDVAKVERAIADGRLKLPTKTRVEQRGCPEPYMTRSAAGGDQSRVEAVRLKRAREQHARDMAARAPQLTFRNEAHKLLDRVQSDPHFGGAVLRSDPEPHAIIMFTGDAAARLRLYTSDPSYKAKSVDLTLAQLEALKSEVEMQLGGLDLGCTMIDGDEEHNTVTVHVTDMGKMKKPIADGRFKPPAKFRLVQGSGCPGFR